MSPEQKVNQESCEGTSGMGLYSADPTSVLPMALDGHVYGLVILHLPYPWMKKVPREPASGTLG